MMKEQPPQVFVALDFQLQAKTLGSKPSDIRLLTSRKAQSLPSPEGRIEARETGGAASDRPIDVDYLAFC
jgi:hypothetical protein